MAAFRYILRNAPHKICIHLPFLIGKPAKTGYVPLFEYLFDILHHLPALFRQGYQLLPSVLFIHTSADKTAFLQPG